jgi:HSP20 family molecular chaperone IbpA
MLPTLHRMFPSRWESPMDVFRRDFDLLGRDLERLFGTWWPEAAEGDGLTAAYPVDVREENGTIIVDAEAPGFGKEEFKVTVENGVLNITAEHKEEKKENGKKLLHERRYKRIERRLTLPAEVDEAKVKATYDKGVLHLEMPKVAEAKAKTITVG